MGETRRNCVCELKAGYLNARRFGALPDHGGALKVMYARRSRTTVSRAWRLRQEKCVAVKEHAETEMNIPVLRYDS